MFLTVHGAVGIVIGSQTGNPVLAFILGFIFHFIGDAIPHDPIELEEWYEAGNKKTKFFLVGAIDLVILGLIIIAMADSGVIITLAIIAGVIGSILPDFIWVGLEAFKIRSRISDWYNEFHNDVHKVFHKKIYLKWWWATLIQISLLVVCLILV